MIQEVGPAGASAKSNAPDSKSYKSFFRKTLTLRRSLTAKRQDEISSTNRTSSRLLMLPTEVRQQIFGYVVGGNVVDVSEHPKPNTRHVYYAYNICANDRLCLIANFLRTVDARRGWLTRATAGGNITCSRGGRSGRSKRWLALFFVCRQTYQDARNFLWSENLLFFWDTDPLWRFTSQIRSLEQSANIRSIALVFSLANTVFALGATAMQLQLQQKLSQWDAGRMSDITSRLCGLRTLYLLLKLPIDLITRFDDREGKWKSLEWLSGLMQFKKLNLQRVRVVVELSKESLSQRSEANTDEIHAFRKRYRITDQDCHEYSRRVESALLGAMTLSPAQESAS